MFLHTFLLVFIAEMADKTQLMIIALANKYKLKSVIFGLILGVISIVFLTILAGSYITKFIPIKYLKILAGIMFIIFGFNNLITKNKVDNKKNLNFKLPIISIAFTFFIAELGDKTQLTTLALTTNNELIEIFMGSCLGLICANLLGLFASNFIFSHLKEETINILSTFFFILCGSLTIFEFLPYNIYLIITYSILIILLAYFTFKINKRKMCYNNLS